MPKPNEQQWLCSDCGSRITTFVKVSESPVCSRHLKPRRMAEVYGIKWFLTNNRVTPMPHNEIEQNKQGESDGN